MKEGISEQLYLKLQKIKKKKKKNYFSIIYLRKKKKIKMNNYTKMNFMF